jgi:hypothetical protein
MIAAGAGKASRSRRIFACSLARGHLKKPPKVRRRLPSIFRPRLFVLRLGSATTLADLSTSLPSTDISFAKNISVNSHGLPNANLGKI